MSRKHRKQRAPKRTVADKTREAFYMLALDWVNLYLNLPQPARTDHHVRRAHKEYGHPAEWASDKSAQIAELFWSWHHMLAEERHEHLPPPNTSEMTRVVNAWRYLDTRWDDLCERVDQEAFSEIRDLHFGIKRSLGLIYPQVTLPVPCPGVDCGLKTLHRSIGVGIDFIICGHCGYTVRDDEDGKNYRWLVRVCLDTLIEAA